MFNVLNKVNELRQNVGGGKGNSLEPPKNLPDLARDIYEKEQPRVRVQETTAPISQQIKSPVTSSTISPAFSKATDKIIEPSKESVPNLDLSLVKQHAQTEQFSNSSYQQRPVQQSINNQQNQTSNWASQNLASSYYDGFNLNSIDDSTGFFKEFEEYIRNNGLNNDVINDLLDKNLLDHMMFYHTTKGDDLPFYVSGGELSHAIKLKLEELQNLEKIWITNKQKTDLLKKINLTLESDIHMRSEELKKLMSESRKRGVTVKTSDFFQLVKPRQVEETLRGVENLKTTLSSTSSSSAPSSSLSPVISQAGHNSSSISLSPQFSIPVHQPAFNSNYTAQTQESPKYMLNKYITNDSSKYFYVNDGQILKSLKDFMEGLEVMNKTTFDHHVNSNKNDFSNWIYGVFGDATLADSIKNLYDREKLWYYLKNNTY